MNINAMVERLDRLESRSTPDSGGASGLRKTHQLILANASPPQICTRNVHLWQCRARELTSTIVPTTSMR